MRIGRICLKAQPLISSAAVCPKMVILLALNHCLLLLHCIVKFDYGPFCHGDAVLSVLSSAVKEG